MFAILFIGFAVNSIEKDKQEMKTRLKFNNIKVTFKRNKK
jgi:hypothetical protein